MSPILPGSPSTSITKATPSSPTSAVPVHSIGARARRWGGVAARRFCRSSTNVLTSTTTATKVDV